MKIIPTLFPEISIVEYKVFPDERGHFFESFNTERYRSHELQIHFVQDNFSRSKQNVLRGLHYQLKKPQGKLIFVTRGAILDVMVDVRLNSPTFGKVLTVELTDQNFRQVYIPPGFAHGFCVLSEMADVIYKVTDYYYPEDERGLLWNDPDLKIDWPVKNPIMNARDQNYLPLKNISTTDLPRYQAP